MKLMSFNTNVGMELFFTDGNYEVDLWLETGPDGEMMDPIRAEFSLADLKHIMLESIVIGCDDVTSGTYRLPHNESTEKTLNDVAELISFFTEMEREMKENLM